MSNSDVAVRGSPNPRALSIAVSPLVGAASFGFNLWVLLHLFGPIPDWQIWIVVVLIFGAAVATAATALVRVVNVALRVLVRRWTWMMRIPTGSIAAAILFAVAWVLYLIDDFGVPRYLWVFDVVFGGVLLGAVCYGSDVLLAKLRRRQRVQAVSRDR